jgi:hypothetical protein
MLKGITWTTMLAIQTPTQAAWYFFSQLVNES